MALAGGVSISFPQRAGYLYQDGMILSPDGHCRPFDVEAARHACGAGAGIVVLKRLADALADRDTIHAVIRGAAINNDGAGKAGYTAPSVDGQVEVIATAQALAGVDPRSIGYIEAHGTATPLGDPIEIAALTQVFRASTPDVGFCRLGSLKANLGHLDAAAGRRGPDQDGACPEASRNSAAGELSSAQSAARAGAKPVRRERRRASVAERSHAAPRGRQFVRDRRNECACRPRGGAAGQSDRCQRAKMSCWFCRRKHRPRSSKRPPISPIVSKRMPTSRCRTSRGRCRSGARALRTAGCRWRGIAPQAVRQLRQPKQAAGFNGAVHEGGERPVAFLFSGQGSQYPAWAPSCIARSRSTGMRSTAARRCSSRIWDWTFAISCIARSRSRFDHQTRITQPALFCTEYALASLWMHWGVLPEAMVGHSIGEYVAAHLAGVMSLEDALESCRRSRTIDSGACRPARWPRCTLSAAELAPRLGARASRSRP